MKNKIYISDSEYTLNIPVFISREFYQYLWKFLSESLKSKVNIDVGNKAELKNIKSLVGFIFLLLI